MITNKDDMIDSRDVLSRIADLEERLADQSLSPEEAEELANLCELNLNARHIREWQYGELLIRSSYWKQYVSDMIEDCYGPLVPKEQRDTWPYRHMRLDLDTCAAELTQDYEEISFGGVDYYIRSL